MKKLLIIEDHSKFIFFKNRKIRTPVELSITDDELKYLKVEMKIKGIQNWNIKTEDPIVVKEKENVEQIITINEIKNEDVVKEEKEMTTLQKLMKEE